MERWRDGETERRRDEEMEGARDGGKKERGGGSGRISAESPFLIGRF
jgi:hypothetical protein